MIIMMGEEDMPKAKGNDIRTKQAHRIRILVG